MWCIKVTINFYESPLCNDSEDEPFDVRPIFNTITDVEENLEIDAEDFEKAVDKIVGQMPVENSDDGADEEPLPSG